MACIWHKQQDQIEYVSPWYKKEKYIKTYEHIICVVRPQEQWRRSPNRPIAIPKQMTQPGRPKRLRRLKHDEIIPPSHMTMRRVGRPMTCLSCGQQGHNTRSCFRGKTYATICKHLHQTLCSIGQFDFMVYV